VWGQMTKHGRVLPPTVVQAQNAFRSLDRLVLFRISGNTSKKSSLEPYRPDALLLVKLLRKFNRADRLHNPPQATAGEPASAGSASGSTVQAAVPSAAEVLSDDSEDPEDSADEEAECDEEAEEEADNVMSLSSDEPMAVTGTPKANTPHRTPTLPAQHTAHIAHAAHTPHTAHSTDTTTQTTQQTTHTTTHDPHYTDNTACTPA
jgi:cytoskeletal protein RodZ